MSEPALLTYAFCSFLGSQPIIGERGDNSLYQEVAEQAFWQLESIPLQFVIQYIFCFLKANIFFFIKRN